jgi:hypothetical protein
VNRGVLVTEGLLDGVITREAARNAPASFDGMDRNRDGDVSRRELLGPAKDFLHINADGDGLIDLAKALRAPCRFAAAALMTRASRPDRVGEPEVVRRGRVGT